MRSVLIILGSTLLLLGGCATIPPLNFTPPDGAVVVERLQRMDAELRSVTVSSAKANEQLGAIQVGFAGNVYENSMKETFKSSLEEAIIKSGLFRDNSKRKVSLLAKVLKFETPGMGIRFQTESIVRYQIIDRETSEVVYDQNIQSIGEVPGDYAFVGAVRASEARNRAMQGNIANFLNDLKVRGISNETKPETFAKPKKIL